MKKEPWIWEREKWGIWEICGKEREMENHVIIYDVLKNKNKKMKEIQNAAVFI